MNSLKNKVCLVPFTSLEIHDNSNFMCCPSWLKKQLPKSGGIKDLWNSPEAQDIRRSVIDGSYEYCDSELCPFLANLLKNDLKNSGPIRDINKLRPEIREYYDKKIVDIPTNPKLINFSFDRTCNFMCPSCRNKMIVASSDKIKKINKRVEEIENLFSKDVEILYISGTADPFASVAYRNYLRNFNPGKYPKLKKIHLHTNASLWDEEMWETMPKIHDYVNSCEISIDAGSKHTYENVTRLGGNWDKLLDNLKFISTIKTITSVKASFVVQTANYKEMKIFADLINDIFGKNGFVFFGKITNWGTFTEQVFDTHKIWDPKHPEHSDFLIEFAKVCHLPHVKHNLHEFAPEKPKSLL